MKQPELSLEIIYLIMLLKTLQRPPVTLTRLMISLISASSPSYSFTCSSHTGLLVVSGMLCLFPASGPLHLLLSAREGLPLSLHSPSLFSSGPTGQASGNGAPCRSLNRDGFLVFMPHSLYPLLYSASQYQRTRYVTDSPGCAGLIVSSAGRPLHGRWALFHSLVCRLYLDQSPDKRVLSEEQGLCDRVTRLGLSTCPHHLVSLPASLLRHIHPW